VLFSIRKAEPTRALDIICRPWAPRARKRDNPFRSSDTNLEQLHKTGAKSWSIVRPMDEDELIPLSSWISDLNGAAFTMSEHPTAGLRMERKSTDPIVGLPRNGQSLYSATSSRTVDLNKPTLGTGYHSYSMFVEGFVLDRLERKEEPSRLGNIPSSWLRLEGWNDTAEDPPSEVWRTLVADQGPNGENPPAYHAHACKQSVKNARPGGILDTERMISEGSSTIVAEYFRRVQAVIWNKCLAWTAENHLALVHEDAAQEDAICVLYGCSVPVVSRRVRKSNEEIDNERANNEAEMREKEKKALKLMEDAMKKRRLRNFRLSVKKAGPQTSNKQLPHYLYAGCVLSVVPMISYTGHRIHLETAALAIGPTLFIPELLLLGMGANEHGREPNLTRALSRLEVVLRSV